MSTTLNVDPVGFLGREFMAYVAASEPGTIDEALRNPEHAEHEKVLAAVARCQNLLVQHGLQIHEVVASVPGGQEQSVGNALRLASGGELPSVPSDTGPVGALARLARDVFPALLLHPAQQPSFWGGSLVSPSHRLLGGAVERNPAADEFQRALADDPLSGLFAAEPPPAFFSFSPGTGAAVELSAIPRGLIGAAVARVVLTEPTLTFSALVDQLRLMVDELRQVQTHGTTPIPIAVSLRGLNAEPGLRIELPWGWLCAMDSQATSAVGDAFQQHGALLVTPLECDVSVQSATSTPVPGTAPEGLQRFQEELEERVQKTMLTLLLLEETPRLSAVATRTVALTPFFGTGWGASDYGPTPVPGPTGTLTSGDIEQVRSLGSLVDSRYADALAIPTRRFVSALSIRHDIEDGLVDAVVAWESLFAGTDVGELRFRIAAAMAWLIGQDADERLDLHREITRLYDDRSKILHRGRAGRDVTEERDRAVELGLKALRVLIERFPELVSDENRGKKLILKGDADSVQPT